ncbi:MAG: hypothetical protein ACTH9L_08525 [Microbacterium gubbeenense]
MNHPTRIAAIASLGAVACASLVGCAGQDAEGGEGDLGTVTVGFLPS